MYQIRSFEPTDYDGIAQIRNLVMPEPITGPTLAEWDRISLTDPTSILHRFVMVDEQDRMVGEGYAEHLHGMADGRWRVHALVHPDFRRQGLGRRLAEEGERIAREGGATELEAWVRGEDDDSFAWTQRRGYVLERQRTESVLDLIKWDTSRFTGLLDGLEQSGIAFRFFPTMPKEEPLRQSIYALEQETVADIPAWNEEYPSYETWEKMNDAEEARRFFAIAVEGDRAVGYSVLYYPRVEGASGYTGFTGVLRAYRGRGIALAVKVLTVQEAVRNGITRLRTNNDPDNPAMLAVNRKLGYDLVPGPRRMRKQL